MNDGARTCAIEIRSFSKNAGFTGVRLSATVIPKDVKSRRCDVTFSVGKTSRYKSLTEHLTLSRKQERLYILTQEKKQLSAQVAYYMNNAKSHQKKA